MSSSEESTPLRGSNSLQHGVNSNEMNRFVTNLFRRENLERASTVAKSRLEELAHSARDGDISIRLLALLGGLSLIISGVLGFLQHLLLLQFIRALLEVYTFALGVVMVMLESRQLHLPETFRNNLYKYALFLKFVWGRGCLYFVAGSLQLTQGSLVDIVVGGFVMLIGGLYVYVGRRTAAKLRDLRRSLYSEQTLQAKFQEADRERDGTLTNEEFRNLCTGLGLDINRREIEASFIHLSQDKGSLTYDQFRSWWASCDEQLMSESLVV